MPGFLERLKGVFGKRSTTTRKNVRNNNASPQKKSGAESSQPNKSAEKAHDTPASPVRTPAEQESRKRNNNSKQTRKHTLNTRKAGEQPTRNAEKAAEEAETAAEHAERAASKAAVLARRASEGEKEAAEEAALVAIKEAKNARIKANEAREKANALSRNNLARYLSVHRREPKDSKQNPAFKPRQFVNFTKEPVKAAHPIKKHISNNKPITGDVLASMSEKVFERLLEQLTKEDLKEAIKRISRATVTADDKGNRVRFIDIEDDEEMARKGEKSKDYFGMMTFNEIDLYQRISDRIDRIKTKIISLH